MSQFQIIKPTIGRVVLFNDGNSDQRVPAQVCYVWSDETINIGGFDSNGEPFSRTSVHLCQGDEECLNGQAEWMTYQKKVAAEQEAAETATA